MVSLDNDEWFQESTKKENNSIKLTEFCLCLRPKDSFKANNKKNHYCVRSVVCLVHICSLESDLSDIQFCITIQLS